MRACGELCTTSNELFGGTVYGARRVILSGLPINEIRQVEKGGFATPIPLPEGNWQQIMTNQVTDLPQSEGMAVGAVFVDRHPKMVHFVPCC